MASFSRKTRIVGALVISGVLIVGSVVISEDGLSFLNPATANAESTQALLQAFATRSSSGDGLPDWEAELYGLDPNNPHSFSPNITDAQAVAEGLIKPKFMTQVLASSTDADASSSDPYPDAPNAAPGSLTEQFSEALLTQYLSQNQDSTVEPSEEDIANLAEGTMQSFAQTHKHQDAYSLSQVQVGGTGPEALKEYSVAVEQVFAINNNVHNEDGKSELDYFTDAIEKNDPSALAEVVAIGAVYTKIGPALMQVKVPTEMQNSHLELANATSRLGADITDLGMMNSDPLRAYLGLSQYQTDADALAKAFSDAGSVFSAEQFTLQSGDPGFFFYRVANNAFSKSQQPQGSVDTSQETTN